MKGNNLVKKTIAFTAVAAMCSSFAVVAEAADGVITSGDSNVVYGNTISFSPYKMSWFGGGDDRVYGTFESNKDHENYKSGVEGSFTWAQGNYQYSENGAYTGNSFGKHLSSQGSGSSYDWTVTMTIYNVPAGTYDFKQWIPLGGLVQSNYSDNTTLTVTSQADGSDVADTVLNLSNIDYCNMSDKGDFVTMGSGLELDGTVTIKYDVPGGKNAYNGNQCLRLDEIQLVKTGDITPATLTADAKAVEAFESTTESVWEATVNLNGGTYNTVSATATTKDDVIKSSEKKTFTTTTGDGSVYVAVAVGKPVTELKGVSVLFENIKAE